MMICTAATDMCRRYNCVHATHHLQNGNCFVTFVMCNRDPCIRVDSS